MYEKFYSLNEKPFSLLPDPEYLYLSKKHKMALTLLEYGILNQAGFCVISGQAGAGKTTLIRYLLSLFDDELNVGLLTNTHQSFDELLTWILLAFDLDHSSKTKAALYQTFVDFLIDQYANKRHTVLIVDEAQNMLPETLEELRMLSNINSEKDQLLQIILVGQPKLLENLRRPDLKQFAQRVAVDYNLEQLDLEETTAYIKHRLKVAGGHPAIFHKEACEQVYKHSKGVPRLINMLCDTALVYGYADQAKVIDANIIRDVIRERDEQGMLARFEDLNEEVEVALYEKLLTSEEPAISLVTDEMTAEKFEQEQVSMNAHASNSPAIDTNNSKPSIQLVSPSENSLQQKKEVTKPSATPDASDYLAQAMALSRDDKSTPQKDVAESTSAEVTVAVNSVEGLVDVNKQDAVKFTVKKDLPEEDVDDMTEHEFLIAGDVSEQEQIDMTNKKTNIPEQVYIQSVNSTGKLGFGFIGFSFGALLSIVVLVFALFNKDVQVVEVATQNNSAEHIKSFEDRINSRLSGLEKERDAALSKLNAIESESKAKLAQAHAEEQARAAELKAKLALQEENQQVEKAKAAMARKNAELARLEKKAEAQKRKAAELAAQQLKKKLLQVQREQEIVAQQKLLTERLALKKLNQQQPTALVTELKPAKNTIAVSTEDTLQENVASISEVKDDNTDTEKSGFLSDPCKGPSARFMSTCNK